MFSTLFYLFILFYDGFFSKSSEEYNAQIALLNQQISTKQYKKALQNAESIQHSSLFTNTEIEMFCYYDDKHVHVPQIGLNGANLSVYLNHSKTPNVEFKKNGELVSLRAIKKGEELLMDYDIAFDAVHRFDWVGSQTHGRKFRKFQAVTAR